MAAYDKGRRKEMIHPAVGVPLRFPVWAAELQRAMHDRLVGDVLWNASLAEYTTFRVGGRAEALVFPKGSNELSCLIRCLNSLDVPWVILGRGSNVVIADTGLKGAVIVLGREFGKIEQVEDAAEGVMVRTEAGCSLAKLVTWVVERGLAGLEFAAGIPGSVGGAIVMNAGAWQGEMKDVLTRVLVMDAEGRITLRQKDEMLFAYRTWGEMQGMIALEGFFRLRKEDPENLRNICREHLRRRKVRQPVNMPSAGSFFKNPTGGVTAGELIDRAGLKGCMIGGAMVSPMHANFIVNTGEATACDIIALMRLVQKTVYEKYGISLEPEVKMLGLE